MMALPQVEDTVVSRVLSDVDASVRELQLNPALPRELKLGDIFYVDSHGIIVRLAAGTQGQFLVMGADGVPEWS